MISKSVPTAFYQNRLTPPGAPRLSSRRADLEPSTLLLPPSPDFNGEIIEQFVGGRSLKNFRSNNVFPASVPANFLSSRIQRLHVAPQPTSKNSIPQDGDDFDPSPSSSIGRGIDESEPPIVGSFTCFQLLEESNEDGPKRAARQPISNTLLGNLGGNGFSLADPMQGSDQPEEPDSDGDGIFDFE